MAGLWADHFNVRWVVSFVQKLTGQVNTTLSFWLVVLVYVILGLLEVEGTARKIGSLPSRRAARILLSGSAETAAEDQAIHDCANPDEHSDRRARLGLCDALRLAARPGMGSDCLHA